MILLRVVGLWIVICFMPRFSALADRFMVAYILNNDTLGFILLL